MKPKEGVFPPEDLQSGRPRASDKPEVQVEIMKDQAVSSRRQLLEKLRSEQNQKMKSRAEAGASVAVSKKMTALRELGRRRAGESQVAAAGKLNYCSAQRGFLF